MGSQNSNDYALVFCKKKLLDMVFVLGEEILQKNYFLYWKLCLSLAQEPPLGISMFFFAPFYMSIVYLMAILKIPNLDHPGMPSCWQFKLALIWFVLVSFGDLSSQLALKFPLFSFDVLDLIHPVRIPQHLLAFGVLLWYAWMSNRR